MSSRSPRLLGVFFALAIWSQTSVGLECSSNWCQSPNAAGNYDCWAGWAAEKCLCEFNKVGSPNFQSFPVLTGNRRELRNSFTDDRDAWEYEYTCCDEFTADMVSPSCADYVGFKDKTFNQNSTRAAAIFGFPGGIYIGKWVFERLDVCITELVDNVETQKCQDFTGKGPQSENFFWQLSTAPGEMYTSITSDISLDRIVASTKETATSSGKLYMGTWNPLLAVFEWIMLDGSPSASWHSVISNSNGTQVSASSTNKQLYKINFDTTALDFSNDTCVYSFEAINNSDTSGCFDEAAEAANVSRPFTFRSFCTKWIAYNKGLFEFNQSLATCLNLNASQPLTHYEYTPQLDFTGYEATLTDHIYVRGWGYVTKDEMGV